MTMYGSPRCPSCAHPVGRCAVTCPALNTMTLPVIAGPDPLWEVPDTVPEDLDGGLSWTGVINQFSEPPQGHAEASARVPAWTLVCLFLGAVFVALGAVFNDPVSRWVWSLL